MYWLHLEASANAALDDLDAFLRDTWLECCGHLSAFKIGGRSFSSNPDPAGWWTDDEGTDTKLGKVLSPGMTFSYEYDFGSTTELTIKVASEREGPATGEPVKLLARNDAPEIPCSYCGKPASSVCAECVWEPDAGWVCDECARGHPCGEEMFLPVVNSPRVGVCGYAG